MHRSTLSRWLSRCHRHTTVIGRHDHDSEQQPMEKRRFSFKKKPSTANISRPKSVVNIGKSKIETVGANDSTHSSDISALESREAQRAVESTMSSLNSDNRTIRSTKSVRSLNISLLSDNSTNIKGIDSMKRSSRKMKKKSPQLLESVIVDIIKPEDVEPNTHPKLPLPSASFEQQQQQRKPDSPRLSLISKRTEFETPDESSESFETLCSNDENENGRQKYRFSTESIKPLKLHRTTEFNESLDSDTEKYNKLKNRSLKMDSLCLPSMNQIILPSEIDKENRAFKFETPAPRVDPMARKSQFFLSGDNTRYFISAVFESSSVKFKKTSDDKLQIDFLAPPIDVLPTTWEQVLVPQKPAHYCRFVSDESTVTFEIDVDPSSVVDVYKTLKYREIWEVTAESSFAHITAEIETTSNLETLYANDRSDVLVNMSYDLNGLSCAVVGYSDKNPDLAYMRALHVEVEAKVLKLSWWAFIVSFIVFFRGLFGLSFVPTFLAFNIEMLCIGCLTFYCFWKSNNGPLKKTISELILKYGF